MIGGILTWWRTCDQHLRFALKSKLKVFNGAFLGEIPKLVKQLSSIISVSTKTRLIKNNITYTNIQKMLFVFTLLFYFKIR